MREIKIGKCYRHFKGKLYRVLDIVYDSESPSDSEYRKIVVYEALYGDHLKYPDITQKYRFEEVEEDN